MHCKTTGYLAITLACLLLPAGCDNTGSTRSTTPDARRPPVPTDLPGSAPRPAGARPSVRDEYRRASSARPVDRSLADTKIALYSPERTGTRYRVPASVIHIFPESAQAYRSLLRAQSRGLVAKQVPDDVVKDLLGQFEERKVMALMQPMSQGEVDRVYQGGEAVITVNRGGQLLGAVQPRVAQGATAEQVQAFVDAKGLVAGVAATYTTFTIETGEGRGAVPRSPQR